MSDQDEDILGRRKSDQYPSPEAVGVLLVQLGRDITEIKADLKEGFRDVGNVMGQHNDRIIALEKFRERVQERDKALAKAEGNFTIRLPMLALLLTTMGIIVGVIVALAQSAGG